MLRRGSKPADIRVLVDRLVFVRAMTTAGWPIPLRRRSQPGAGEPSVLLLGAGAALNFNQNFACSDCHITYEEPDPRLFSFNNPFGACPECQGFGRAVGIDMDLVVPDKGRTLREGAIQPWTTPKFKELLRTSSRVAPKAGVRMDVPYRLLTERNGRSSWRDTAISWAIYGSSAWSSGRATRSTTGCC